MSSHDDNYYGQSKQYQEQNQPHNRVYGNSLNDITSQGESSYPNPQHQKYPAQPNAPYGYVPAEHPEGKRNADLSMYMGIIGIFFFSLIFGIIALVFANKAKQFGVEAKAGTILGWIDIIFGVIIGLFFVFFFIVAIGAGMSAPTSESVPMQP